MRHWILLIAMLPVIVAAEETVPAVTWVKDSTVPLLQLTGEKFQFFSSGYYFTEDTYARTLTRYGLNGADLGVPVSFPDKMLFIFGDSWGYRATSDRKFVWHPGWGKDDSIGYIDLPFDFSACHAMEDLDQQIQAGKRPPATDYSHAPLLKFYVRPKPSEQEPLFQPTRIAKLRPDQGVGSYEVPTGAFALNGYLYLFYNVNYQEERGPDPPIVYFLNCVLARSDQKYTEWSSTAPPTFTKLYDFSEHERVAVMTAPPPDAHAPGKFIHAAPVVMEHTELDAAHVLPLLPRELQSAKQVIFVWGSSWRYVHSNLYLAAVSADDIEATADGKRDASKWWYFTGNEQGTAQWSHDEPAAAPLLDSWRPGREPCIGEHSVKWNSHLKQFVLSYQDRYIDIIFRTAPTPLGPWSSEMRVFGLFNPWADKFIHHRGKDPITPNPVETFRPDGKPFLAPENSGATYGPYMLDSDTVNPDGSVTVYFVMSTWTTYNVWLMRTTFAINR